MFKIYYKMSTYKIIPKQNPLQFHTYSKLSGSSVSNFRSKIDNNQNTNREVCNNNFEDITQHNYSEDDDHDKKVDLVFSAKDLQCDKDIADYLDYLIRPININDNYVELCQHHYELDYNVENQVPGAKQSTSSILRRDDIDDKKLAGEGLRAINSSPHSEYNTLEEFGSTPNKIEAPVSVLEAMNEFDVHRPLTQSQIKIDHNLNQEDSKDVKQKIKIIINLNFLVELRKKEGRPLLKHFFAFRPPKKNQSFRRRNRLVPGEELMEGPTRPTFRKFEKSNISGYIVSYV
ncbi:hypothetical protein J6590_074121 [Homalodisca vitripennis]|nr:hypothetical protein J6590_074121 [Homalodisca vitripennis]